MNTLPIRTEITHYVPHYALEAYVYEVYNVTLEIAASEECGNDTSLHFNIDGEFDTNEAEEFIGSRFCHKYGSTRLVLNMLCADKHIEPGHYIVEVSW